MTKLTKIQQRELEEKQGAFERLSDLCRFLDPDIVCMEASEGFRYVSVTYKSGYVKEIDIAGDNAQALCFDVMAALSD